MFDAMSEPKGLLTLCFIVLERPTSTDVQDVDGPNAHGGTNGSKQ